MKILILGAAGEVGLMIKDLLLKETDYQLVLYARNASERIKTTDLSREKTVDGDFMEKNNLIEAMEGVDAVYLNDMGNSTAVNLIIDVMKECKVSRIIGATILGLYHEVSGAFGKWNEQIIGNSPRYNEQRKSAAIVENSGLQYTLLRLSWLYNDPGNEKYMLTQKGEPFVGAQLPRQAIARLVLDILTDTSNVFINKNLGVSEPDTDWAKPSFY